MTLTCFGAAGEVTGAKHLIEVAGKRILLDCGMFQGPHEAAHHHNAVLPFEASSINAVVLSHGHLDHCGSLPTLVKQGFSGPIYTTVATRDVAELIMRDSAHIQAQDAEYANRHRRPEHATRVPLYTMDDVERVLPLVVGIAYRECRQIFLGVELCFYNAGHILGSALVHLTVQDGDRTLRIAYTGDLGQRNMPIISDPEALPETDVMIAESTYGNRAHENVAERASTLIKVVRRALDTGGKIFVPCFALGRMQTLIYTLHKLTDAGELPRIPIYVDSPLAVDLTEVFSRHPECYDEETRRLFTRNHEDPFGFRNLKYVSTVEDSKKLNATPGPAIILATSGMAESGRILHHFKNGLSDERNTVLIVGYMVEGTLGRAILEGDKRVKIFHEWHDVRAEVVKINAFSAHADQSELAHFILTTRGLRQVVLVHGENPARQALAQLLHEQARDLIVLQPRKGDPISIG